MSVPRGSTVLLRKFARVYGQKRAYYDRVENNLPEIGKSDTGNNNNNNNNNDSSYNNNNNNFIKSQASSLALEDVCGEASLAQVLKTVLITLFPKYRSRADNSFSVLRTATILLISCFNYSLYFT